MLRGRRFRTGLLAVVGTLATLTSLGCASASREVSLTAEQKRLNVESFDHAWTKIRDDYWDPELGGLDWQAVRDELRPKIERAATMAEARRVMYDMVERLGVSHFMFIPAELSRDTDGPDDADYEEGVTGIDLRVVDGHALVTSVADGSPAAAAGVRAGWEIVRVGDIDIVSRLRAREQTLQNSTKKELALTYSVMPLLFGRPGDSVTVEFLDGDDRTVEVDIALSQPRGRKASLGFIHNVYVWIEVKTLDDDIGYIAFNAFFDPPVVMTKFNDAMRSFLDAKGLIIDLRGNAGGLGAMAMGMMGWLIGEHDQHIGTLQMRAQEFKLIVKPRPKTYAGPLVVLVDGLSGSGSEFFSGGLQEMGRACIVGSRTKGEALPGQIEKLPNGDVFLYATANYISVHGNVLEGVGVTPDLEVWPTREALLGGHDLALEAAVRWIHSQE